MATEANDGKSAVDPALPEFSLESHDVSIKKTVEHLYGGSMKLDERTGRLVPDNDNARPIVGPAGLWY